MSVEKTSDEQKNLATDAVVAGSFTEYYKPAIGYLVIAILIGPVLALSSWVPSIGGLLIVVFYLIYPVIRIIMAGGPPEFNIKVLPETVIDSWVESDFNGNPVRKYRVVEGAVDPWHASINFAATNILRFDLSVMFFSGIEAFAQSYHLYLARKNWNNNQNLLRPSAKWPEYPAFITFFSGAILTLGWFWCTSFLAYEPPVMSESVTQSYHQQFRVGQEFELIDLQNNELSGFRFRVDAKPRPHEEHSGWEFTMSCAHTSLPEKSVRYNGRVMYQLPNEDDYPISIRPHDRGSVQRLEQETKLNFPQSLTLKREAGGDSLIDHQGRWRLASIDSRKEATNPPN